MKSAASLFPLALAVAVSLPCPAEVASGLSAAGMIETIPPQPGNLTVPATANSLPIQLNYVGAFDEHLGLAEVELFYRTDSGIWQSTGLSSASASGSFFFSPVEGDNIYFLQLVARDLGGNHSSIPTGSGGIGHGALEYQEGSSVMEWWVIE